jgi:chemotaxis protein methyltransferase CheR
VTPKPAGRGQFGYGAEGIPLPDNAYALLRDLVVERTGVLFDDAKRGLLSDKLLDLVIARGLTSFLDYYYLLRYDDDADAEWARVLDALAVPETYFWRQPEQFLTLARVIAPAHFAERADQPLRIWSAACCSGEEPLSVAMALAEEGLLHTHPIEIMATDASGAMIARARRAVYGDRAFRQLPLALREKYFEDAADGTHRPVDAIARHIRHAVANLANPRDVARFAPADVIFCRNVFIYFADDAIRNVVAEFHRAMPAHGHLFVAASESLTRLGVDFELTEIGGSFVYVKGGERRPEQRPRLSQFTRAPAAPTRPIEDAWPRQA